MDKIEKIDKSLEEELKEEIKKEIIKLPFFIHGKVLIAFARHFAKWGVEWMAGQGVTKEAVIGMATKDIEINVSQRTLDALGLGPGDKVIVQIRKKED